jgi:hypothetical protein
VSTGQDYRRAHTLLVAGGDSRSSQVSSTVDRITFADRDPNTEPLRFTEGLRGRPPGWGIGWGTDPPETENPSKGGRISNLRCPIRLLMIARYHQTLLSRSSGRSS